MLGVSPLSSEPLSGLPSSANKINVSWLEIRANVGGGSVTGTLSATEGADTLAGVGAVTITGTSSITESADTLSSAGTIAVTGTASITESADTSTSVGTVTVTGTLSATEGDDTLSGTGSIGTIVDGNLSATEADDTLSATGVITNDVVGTLTATEGADTLSGVGTVGIVGTASITESGDTITAAAGVFVAAILAQAEAADTASAAAAIFIAAQLSAVESGDTLVGTGTLSNGPIGVLDVTEGADTLSATGLIEGVGTGGEPSNEVILNPKRHYIRRGKRIILFNSTQEADAYIAAEKEADAVIAKVNPSRKERKRIKERIFPAAETIDTGTLALQTARFDIPADIPLLIKQNDIEELVRIAMLARLMQDEEDMELLMLL